MVSSEAITAAVISTSLISLAPNILLLLFPKYAAGEGEHSSSLALGQALAAGSLLGDVFLHTIPHASSADNFGLWILLGFAVFLLVDMLIRSFADHSHGHSHQTNTPPKQGSESAEHHAPQYKTSTILLNLAADALHNFTDGLAIGASFASVADESSSVLSLLQSRGGLATLSILFHEIPVSTVVCYTAVCCFRISNPSHPIYFVAARIG
jgi:zinc transporter 7